MVLFGQPEMNRLLLLPLAYCAVAGCDTRHRPADVSGVTAAEREARNRTYVDGGWDTVYSVGGTLQDSLLLKPRLLAARQGLLYLYDYVDAQIKAFDAAGDLRWRFGNRGRGPGEFTNALDLEVASDGTVWVLDSGTGRITVISPNGSLRRMIQVSAARIKDVVPATNELIVTSVSPDHFLLVIDSLGQVVNRVGFPLEELQRVEPTMRQTFSAVSPDGRTWAAFFPFGDPLVVYEGLRLRCSGKLIEGRDFPAPSPDASAWATAIALTDSSVYILAKGETADALRIVDEYSATDCSYRRTLRLPGRFLTMAFSDGIFFFAHEDPAPTIVALRPVSP